MTTQAMTTQTTTTQPDREAVTTLISRFFRALDEREFDGNWAGDFCADDIRMVTPIGTADGAAAVRHTEEALLRFARTQHMATDILVDVEPTSGRATASWNALMTHVHYDSTLQRRGEGADPVFTVGGYYRAELLRTPDGWRIRQVSIEAIWTTGEPPPLPDGAGGR